MRRGRRGGSSAGRRRRWLDGAWRGRRLDGSCLIAAAAVAAAAAIAAALSGTQAWLCLQA